MSEEDSRLYIKACTKSNVMHSREGDRLLLYDPATGNVCRIMGVGTRIWELCDGKRTIKDIIDTIYVEYDVQRETLVVDVLEFVTALMQRGFILIST